MRQRRDDVIGSGRAEEASYQRRDVVVRDVALPLRQEYGRFEESQLGRRVEAVAVPDRSEAERAEAVAPERRDVVRGGEVSSDADAASFLLQQRALALQRAATKDSVGTCYHMPRTVRVFLSVSTLCCAWLLTESCVITCSSLCGVCVCVACVCLCVFVCVCCSVWLAYAPPAICGWGCTVPGCGVWPVQ